ncbi:unnamed protein product [Arctia plantaginis]|uniref:Autophagy-related protein 16 domain-containing protein n=1 Tax=Arctia plantaginis TaxID=874455 RepID=A0A8S0ZRD4_ARCPL|nr:unnamed protein product [Arctia plantaginis]
MEGSEWRSNIVGQLQARNKMETVSFQDIISFQSKLFDNVNTLKNENLQLTLLNERIRFSGTDIVLSSTGAASNEKIQAMEQKILLQQEELTSLHRRRGENAQQIMSLNEKLHDLEKQLQTKDIVISEHTAVIASLRAEIQMYETNMVELQGLNQVLRDEHQALQIAFASIEEKLRKAQRQFFSAKRQAVLDCGRTMVSREMTYPQHNRSLKEKQTSRQVQAAKKCHISFQSAATCIAISTTWSLLGWCQVAISARPISTQIYPMPQDLVNVKRTSNIEKKDLTNTRKPQGCLLARE